MGILCRHRRQWLPHSALELLGIDPRNDADKLTGAKKPRMLKSIQAAFDRAIAHRHVISAIAKGGEKRGHRTFDTVIDL